MAAPRRAGCERALAGREDCIESSSTLGGHRARSARDRSPTFLINDQTSHLAGVPVTEVRVVILTLLVTMGSVAVGWTDAVAQNPLQHPPNSGPSPVLIRVVTVNWTVQGCAVQSRTTSGDTFEAGTSFDVRAILVDRSEEVPCTLTTVSVSPSNFELVESNLPVTDPAGGSASIVVTILAPDYASPTALFLEFAAEA